MKLRIKGNSLRLRLTRSEVSELCSSGYLEEHISFGSNELIYSLLSDENIRELSAGFSGSKIIVVIPSTLIQNWRDNEIISFDSVISLNENEKLYILVEKDFQCLEKTTEDQSDNYENPNKTC